MVSWRHSEEGMRIDPREEGRRGLHWLGLPHWLPAKEHPGVMLGTKEKSKLTLSVRISIACAPPKMIAVAIP